VLNDVVQGNSGEAEVEGFITAVVSAGRVKLGTVEVDASSASFSPASLQLAVGTRIEVRGHWQSGVLKAASVKAEDAESLGQVELEAPISEFNSLSDFVVRGQRCDASGITKVENGTLADIKLGAKVHLKGTKAGNIVKVTQLSVES
jgi:hypothetical protein